MSLEWTLSNLHGIFPSSALSCFICFLIIIACLLGDYLVEVSSSIGPAGNEHVIRALADNSTHAVIGALVWALVENTGLLSDWKKWLNCIFCAILAASVDLDHFLAANSLDIKRALNLPRRPLFHNTTLIPVVVIFTWMLRYYRPGLEIFSLMFLSSWLSHHLRDANHRGLWLFPYGHTPVFSTYLYISLILLLAVFVRIIYWHCIISTRLKRDVSSDIV